MIVKVYKYLISLCFFGIFVSGSAFSAPVLQEIDGIVLDWGHMTLSWSEEIKAETDDEAFEALGKKAWLKAHRDLTQLVKKIHASKLYGALLETYPAHVVKKATAKTVKGLVSKNTTYYSSGVSKVQFEASLTDVFYDESLHLAEKSKGLKAKYTGILLKLDQVSSPSPIFEIVDERGMVLYSLSKVSRESFRKNLMARWFVDPMKSEIEKYVGKNPIVLKAKLLGSHKILVNRRLWDKAMESTSEVLNHSKVMVSLPK